MCFSYGQTARLTIYRILFCFNMKNAMIAEKLRWDSILHVLVEREGKTQEKAIWADFKKKYIQICK